MKSEKMNLDAAAALAKRLWPAHAGWASHYAGSPEAGISPTYSVGIMEPTGQYVGCRTLGTSVKSFEQAFERADAAIAKQQEPRVSRKKPEGPWPQEALGF